MQLSGYAIFWILVCCATVGYAQQVVVRGTVTDNREQLVPDANVFIKGTVYGATTAADGSFTFTTPTLGDTVLMVRHVAMQTAEQPITIQTGMAPITVQIHPRSTLLEEASVERRNHRMIDNNRAISLNTMDVDTSPGSDGDVTTALRQFPGVQTVGESGALFVRGGSGEESKTFIDGLEITHPYVTGVPDIAQRTRFSSHLFDGITFSTGGYAPDYGGALSSILSLDSRAHPSQSSTVIALLPYGPQVGHDQRFNERTSAGIDLGYTNFSPYYKLINHRTDWTQAPESWTANANFRRSTADGGMIKWYGYGSSSSQAANLPNENQRGQPTYLGVDNRNAVSLLTWEQPLKNEGSFYLGYGFNFNRDKYQTAQTVTSSQTQHQLRLAIRSPLVGRSSIDAGVEGYSVRFSPSNMVRLSDYKAAAWAEVTLPIAGKATLHPGLRTDYSSLLDRAVVSPRLTVAYQLSTANRLSVAWGAYTQQPDYRYLAVVPHIGYQRANHYVANFQHTRGGHLLRVEGYYKDYRALLTTGNRLANDGSGTASGVELFFRNQQGDRGLDYWVSYSYLHTERQYLDYPIQAMPTFTTPHTAHAVVKQFIEPIGVYVGGSYTFATGRPYFNPNNPAFLGDRTAAYHNVNINAAVLRKWGNTFITVVAALNNVLDNRQVFGYRYAGDGSFRVPIELPYGRALLIAAFISIGRDRSDEILNQLP